ncbi:TetR/AcrR family transcriptional regulator [Natronospora cellulosivora (SeqCode)]
MARLSSEERRKEILDVVLKIIHEEGFYNLSIRNIAEKINISEAAIYRHFKNKKAIIDKLSDLIFQTPFWKKENTEGNLFDLLQIIMERQFSFLEENPYLTAIIFQEEIFREYTDIGEKIKECRKDKENTVLKIIEKGQERGEFKDDVNPLIFARLYMGAIRVSIINWRANNFSFSLDGEAEEICKELFKILK